MDMEVLQKYKVGNGGDYSLVYKCEGKDDPYGDMTVQNAEEIAGEVAINLTGEVLMATTVEEVDDMLDSYGGGDEAVSINVYTNSMKHYSLENQEEAAEKLGEGEDPESRKFIFHCPHCRNTYESPGECWFCRKPLEDGDGS